MSAAEVLTPEAETLDMDALLLERDRYRQRLEDIATFLRSARIPANASAEVGSAALAYVAALTAQALES